MPSREQGLESHFTLRVQTIVSEKTVVGGQGEDDLGGTGIKSAIEFLLFDSAQETVEVGQHDAVGEFGARINGVDFATIFGDGGKGDNVIQVPAETGFCVVDVVDQRFHILFRAYN